MRKEYPAERFPCKIIPGRNCLSCPFDDCISTGSKTPISNEEKEIIKSARAKFGIKPTLIDLSFPKDKKIALTKRSKNAYLSKLKSYKRSKAWIDKELKKYTFSSAKPNDFISSNFYTQADVSDSFYFS